MKHYIFTEDWFSHNIVSWTEHLSEFKSKPVNFLEVGCFEGRATCWLLDNILTHENATITCVDTFAGSPEHDLMKTQLDGMKDRFLHNINESGSPQKVFILTQKSNKALKGIRLYRFDGAYIDGSHASADVFIDIALVWDLIKIGGIIIFDDYHWSGAWEFDPLQRCDHPKPAIDAFLTCFADQIELIHMGYQVIVRKTERKRAGVYKI